MDLIRKYLRIVISLLYVAFGLSQFFMPWPPLKACPIHVFTTLSLVFLYLPLYKQNDNSNKAIYNICNIVDLLFTVISLLIVFYFYKETNRIQERIEYVSPILQSDMIVFVVGTLLMLEGVRRCVGFSLLSVVILFIVYGFWGKFLPGWLKFDGFSLANMTEINILGVQGIFGTTSQTAINFVFYFIFFGAVFSATGGGKIFIDISLMVTRKLAGGAAKSAILGSALFGTVSGSAVSNVTSTGVLTIPLMKKIGYTPEQASAVEAIASTGGQLMPPIMGVAAFVMADFMALPYSRIALAGIIPAIGFYFALYFNVDLKARKTNESNEVLKTISIEPIKPRIHLLLGPIALVASLFLGFSAPLAALIGTLFSFIAPFLRRHTWYNFKDLFNMLLDTAKQMATVSIPLAAVGIIMVVAMQSNLAMKFVLQIASLGESSLVLSLLAVIAGCIIMGMGLPTVAAYLIGAVMFVPGLVNLGVDRLAAHFFVMYYSILSMVTPPVALCSYTAAGIGKANIFDTGIKAFILSGVVFIIPFGFVKDTTLLWYGSYFDIFVSAITMIIAVYSWAIFVQGWCNKNLNILGRLLALAASFLLILSISFTPTWYAGIVLFAFIIIWTYKVKKGLIIKKS